MKNSSVAPIIPIVAIQSLFNLLLNDEAGCTLKRRVDDFDKWKQ
jgi:hypothetical protein